MRTFLFYVGTDRECVKVMGEPDYDGWARVLLYIDLHTGAVTPGDPRPGRDVRWMPGFQRLLDSGHVMDLS